MLTERPARLASIAIIMLLIGSGTAFAYTTRVQSIGFHPAAGQPTPSPADGSNETGTSTNSTESESTTHTFTASSSMTGSTTHTENETHTSTTFHETNSTNETESTTSTHSATETENETRSTSFAHTGENSTASFSSAEHENETSTNSSEVGLGHELSFTMVAANLTGIGVPTGYSAGRGVASLNVEPGAIGVHLELVHLSPSTRYSLTMSLNGTEMHLGNFSSTSEGTAEAELSVPVRVGSYSVSFSVADTSTLQDPFVVLVSSPSTLTAIVSRPAEGQSSSDAGQRFTTVRGGESESSDISQAVNRKLIPVVVHVTNHGINYSVIDHNFTVFVGRVNDSGIQISVSAVNGSSPRVILVNLTGSQTLNLQSGSVVVTFDGARVSEAASLTQVLNPTPTGAPLFLVIGTSAGYQLLVSIPHFSTHIIQILPAVAQAVGSFLAVDGPALALSLLVVSVAFAAVYARRPRVRL